ncbi:class I SAM-dependent methyltransferase [Chryseobacterium caseinilyticum]|uniref:Class I SAM-dependent methyltransferase n=1 Tax=Chryseobacterium caseinilyticum TaxID=2771428 RepID=A0ABR8ZGB5_9FLAO|nr:class I SAM-dependent methyltransferase [Chryseobacterium caseinilyticum]MBD8084315.1 class I SAM-dependent methyltransferase [Chryseobacterium caseinilyticum]
MTEQIQYTVKDGIRCYAPELASENGDYPQEAFSILFDLEKDNFWFNSRNRMIKHFISKKISAANPSFLEIGCGTGYVLNNISKNFPDIKLTASEIHLEGIKFAKRRVPQADFVQLDATKMPYTDVFDGIGAFDVLEHIDDDIGVMKGVHKALKKGGYFFITVPQHKFMWSINDEIAFHKRRYTRKELVTKLKKSDFDIDFVSSFVFTLFPLMAISRILKSSKKEQITNDVIIREVKNLRVGKFTNKIFSILMRIDEYLIEKNISLPFGGSLVVIAKK